MAKYIVLIYEDEKRWEQADERTNGEVFQKHMEFRGRNGAAVVGGEPLEFTVTATSVRPDGPGGFVVTDGPFIETKEALCGFYLIEAADDAAAVELAKQVPAPYGGVEVRRVRAMEH
jgi:hypothetical protein